MKRKRFPRDKSLKEIFPGVYIKGLALFTENLAPGKRVYKEKLVKRDGKEFREWNPKRSKLAAGIRNKLRTFPFMKGSTVLYLGSAEGTTASHVSDIIGSSGTLFGVDISANVMRKFLLLCKERANMFPLLYSANHPETYADIVGTVDIVFQDVAQKNQSEIFEKNMQFVKKGGYGLLSLKARSINATLPANQVIGKEKQYLQTKFKLIESVDLHPYEREHALLVFQK
jgi:fibrillarin-like pre-rRNA processing protein